MCGQTVFYAAKNSRLFENVNKASSILQALLNTKPAFARPFLQNH
jgi:hypothetical protein